MKPTKQILAALRGTRTLEDFDAKELVRAAAENIWHIPVDIEPARENELAFLPADERSVMLAAIALEVPAHPAKLVARSGAPGLLAQAWTVMASVWLRDGKGQKDSHEGRDFITYGASPVGLMFELADLQAPRTIDSWRVVGKSADHAFFSGSVFVYTTDGIRALVGLEGGRRYILCEISNLQIESLASSAGKPTREREPKEPKSSLAMDLLA